MQIRVVTLRYNEAQQGFPEEALRAATFGREVLCASEHFFTYGNARGRDARAPSGENRFWKQEGMDGCNHGERQ